MKILQTLWPNAFFNLYGNERMKSRAVLLLSDGKWVTEREWALKNHEMYFATLQIKALVVIWEKSIFLRCRFLMCSGNDGLIASTSPGCSIRVLLLNVSEKKKKQLSESDTQISILWQSPSYIMWTITPLTEECHVSLPSNPRGLWCHVTQETLFNVKS